MAVVNKEVFSTDETLWVQKEGPGTDFELMGECYQIGDTTEPQGDRTPHYCRDLTRGAGNFKISKQTRGMPGLITFQLSAPKYRMNNLLRTLTCPFDLQAVVKSCGDQTTQVGWEQIDHYRNCEITNRSKSASASRDSEERVLITADVSASDFVELREITFARQATTEINGQNAIAVCDEAKCADECGDYSPGCQVLVSAGDRTGAVSANVLRSINGGGTWAATATDPFAVSEDIADIVCNADRIIAGLGTDRGAAAPAVSYSDDNGATWTEVAMPAPAANGHIWDLCKLDTRHLWACGNTGYIWFSDDWGLTWVTQDAGVASGGVALNAIHFINEFVGYAIGTAGAVVKTVDGGGTWAAATVPAASAGNTIFAVTEDLVYAGLANGNLYVSTDGAVTWAQRAFPGDGVGVTQWVGFYDEQFGFMLHDTAAPVGHVYRTVDGGANWEDQNVVANVGLNSMAICNPNAAFVVGEATAGPLAFIGEVTG